MLLVNKKVVGLMKDECNGRIMTEFIGLRSKMYGVRVEGQDHIKKVKGVKTRVVEKTVAFLQFLREKLIKRRAQRIIRSRLHTEKQIKIALSPHDDKRYLPPDTTDTLPWGHYRIPCANHDGIPPTPEPMIE